MVSEILTEEEKNWCTLCLGLGLRPSEVDMIISSNIRNKYLIEKGRVKIYQSKLVTLSVDKRYKEVMITYDFQKNVVKLLKKDTKYK